MRVAVLVLGIIAAILALPAAVCGGACAAGLSSLAEGATESSTNDIGSFYMVLGILASVFTLIGSIGAYAAARKTVLRIIFAILILVATVLMLLNSGLTLNWLMGIIPVLLMLITSVLAFVAKPKD